MSEHEGDVVVNNRRPGWSLATTLSQAQTWEWCTELFLSPSYDHPLEQIDAIT